MEALFSMKSKSSQIIAVAIVILLILVGVAAVILLDEYKEEEMEEKEKIILEVGQKLLEKEYIFSEPIVEENGDFMNVYINESDFNSIQDQRS